MRPTFLEVVWAFGVAAVVVTPMVIAASCSWADSGRWERACAQAGGIAVNRSHPANRVCIRAEQLINLEPQR